MPKIVDKRPKVYQVVVDGFTITGSEQWCQRIVKTAQNKGCNYSQIKEVK